MKNKQCLLTAFFLLITFMSSVLLVMPAYAQPNTVPIQYTQLGICIDGSGSIDSEEWITFTQGLASAAQFNIPINGTVELTVVQFAGGFNSYAVVEVAPVVIDSQSAADLAALTIRNISQGKGSTPLAKGIDLLTAQMATSPFSQKAQWQVINISTDGMPTSPIGTFNGGEVAKRNAIKAVKKAVAAGIDEVSVEAIGFKPENFEWLKSELIYPQPGIEAPPFPPRAPLKSGFVVAVASFDDYKAVISAKFQAIIPHTITLEPLFANYKVGVYHQVMLTLTDIYNVPVENMDITFEVISGPHEGTKSIEMITTDAEGKAFWGYTGTKEGADTIIATSVSLTSNKVSCSWEKDALPPAIPGMTGWGFIATIIAFIALAFVMLRKKTGFSL